MNILNFRNESINKSVLTLKDQKLFCSGHDIYLEYKKELFVGLKNILCLIEMTKILRKRLFSTQDPIHILVLNKMTIWREYYKDIFQETFLIMSSYDILGPRG